MSMYRDDIDALDAEVERFRRRLRDYRDTPESSDADTVRSAALRRASMDLTRALAALRDPHRRVQP